MNRWVWIVGGGVLLYLWSQAQAQSAAAAAGEVAPAPGTPAGTPVTVTQSPYTAPPAATVTAANTPAGSTSTTVEPAARSLSFQNKLVYYIGHSGVSDTFIQGMQTPDVWNYYLDSYLASLGTSYSAPAPEDLFPNTTNAHQPVTFNQWYAAVQSALPNGLSGLGWPWGRSMGGGRVIPMFRSYGGWTA